MKISITSLEAVVHSLKKALRSNLMHRSSAAVRGFIRQDITALREVMEVRKVILRKAI